MVFGIHGSSLYRNSSLASRDLIGISAYIRHRFRNDLNLNLYRYNFVPSQPLQLWHKAIVETAKLCSDKINEELPTSNKNTKVLQICANSSCRWNRVLPCCLPAMCAGLQVNYDRETFCSGTHRGPGERESQKSTMDPAKMRSNAGVKRVLTRLR